MIQSFLKRHRKFRSRSHPVTGGFTLIELLVAMIVASLISVGLLFVVVQLIQTNLRESARSDTQRDLQAALDYIARDVREAVYVYDANCLLDQPTANPTLCPGLRNYLPTSISGTSGFGGTDGNGTNVPVLAFWRLNPLPSGVKNVCTTAYSQNPLPTSLPTINGVPCLAGQMYSLVVYSLNNDSTKVVSRGRARIMRYELPQFTTQSIQSSPPSTTTGWADPMGSDTTFLTWPVSQTTLNAGLPTITTRPIDTNSLISLPLTDFVDWNGLYTRSADGTVTGIGQAPDRSVENLVLTPPSATNPPRGFYIYVKGAASGGVLNQQVVIRIQGDAAGRPGIPKGTVPITQPVVPISLETTVLTRGVVNKTQ